MTGGGSEGEAGRPLRRLEMSKEAAGQIKAKLERALGLVNAVLGQVWRSEVGPDRRSGRIRKKEGYI